MTIRRPPQDIERIKFGKSNDLRLVKACLSDSKILAENMVALYISLYLLKNKSQIRLP